MNEELKAFRKIRKNLNSYEFTDEYKKNKKLIEESLKAFEIIKKKNVDITTLLDCRNAKEYNRWIDVRSHYSYPPLELTQEEYDFLKEVLL